MSFHYPHSPGWFPYRQNQGGYIQQKEDQNRSNSVQDAGVETQIQGDNYGAGYGLPVQDTASQRPGSSLYKAHSTSYHGASPDMQYMMQMMMDVRNQLEQLNYLIAQNNRLLQFMHEQEDTKCIQGSGGGAVIVRM
ncbi:hypothetical protein GCM10008931_11960 [Oceanobacillus oncorhynchi subsp. oncorhynchi]|uniref:hypothetical protein n=1 Tax=Oceanobacillus oncorhynchi TaxID=545501 RepID=UPI0031D1D55A